MIKTRMPFDRSFAMDEANLRGFLFTKYAESERFDHLSDFVARLLFRVALLPSFLFINEAVQSA